MAPWLPKKGCHNLARQGGKTVWGLWPKHAWEESEVDHLVAETGIASDVEVVQCRADDPEPARREIASISMQRAIALADAGKHPVSLVWFIAQGHRTDAERLYPGLPALAKRSITTFVVDPPTLDSEGPRRLDPPFDAVISFDSKLGAIEHWPAIDPIVTSSRHLSGAICDSAHGAAVRDARALLANLRELDPQLTERDLSGIDPTEH